MPNRTHDIPKGIPPATDQQSKDTDNYAIAELTVKRVLDATRPKGIEARSWAAIVGQASQADREWNKHEGIADPWAEGSQGRQEFAPQIADTPGPVPIPVVWTRQDATRDEFRIAVGKTFPTTGPASTRGAVLLAHANYGNDAGGGVFPSNTTIAKRLSLTRGTVNEHVRWAVKAGWLRRTGVRGRTNIYQLTTPGEIV
jgi:hypothetical protein